MKSSSRALGQRFTGFGADNFQLAMLRLVGEIAERALAEAFYSINLQPRK